MKEEPKQGKIDLTPLAEILARFRDVDGALLPILHAVQKEFGFIPPEAVLPIASFLHATAPQIYAIITFYSEFRTKPHCDTVITVCRGPACRLNGATKLENQLANRLAVAADQTGATTAIETSSCLGICALAPALSIGHEAIGRVGEEELGEIVEASQKRNGGAKP